MSIDDYLDSNVLSYTVNGNEATGECPLCGKSRSHWYIHVGHEVDREGRSRHGRWLCFSCGERGDFWRLLGHIEGLSPSQAKAWWMLQGRTEALAPVSVNRARERLHLLMHGRGEAAQIDTPLPEGFRRVKRRRPKMLVDRGVELLTARAFGLGYCNEGEMSGRVVFPIACPLGRSWTARATGRTLPKYFGGDDAGRLLYGWDVAMAGGIPDRLVVCEGPMDAVSLYQAGIPAVAVMGKRISDEKAGLIRRTGARLLVALDSGETDDALEVSDALGSAEVVMLKSGDPGDADPATLTQAVGTALKADEAACQNFRSKTARLRKRFTGRR